MKNNNIPNPLHLRIVMIRKIVTLTFAFWTAGPHIVFSQGYKVDPGQHESGFKWYGNGWKIF